MLDDQEEEIVNKVRDLIGEHFTNFSLCVVTESGELFYDYRDRFVGKALFVAAIEDMESDVGVDWLDWDDDDDGDDEWKETNDVTE
jgi:hypothetical protein